MWYKSGDNNPNRVNNRQYLRYWKWELFRRSNCPTTQLTVSLINFWSTFAFSPKWLLFWLTVGSNIMQIDSNFIFHSIFCYFVALNKKLFYPKLRSTYRTFDVFVIHCIHSYIGLSLLFIQIKWRLVCISNDI